MKNRSVILPLLTATLFAIPVFAQSEAPAAPEAASLKGPHPRRAEFVKRFDQDGDGQLNDTEKAAAQKARKHFRHEMEHRMMRGYMARMHGMQRMHRMDGRGGPQGARFRGPGQFGFAGPRGPQAAGFRGKMRGEIVKRFDHDADGRLNDTERAEAKKAGEEMRAKAKVRHQEMLSRFDRDGDGKLGEPERQEMRNAWEKFIQQQPALPAKPAGN